MSPLQVAQAYRAYFDDSFKAIGGTKALDAIESPQAKDLMMDALVTRGLDSTAIIVQNGINTVLGKTKHTDEILGSKTLKDYSTLANSPRTRVDLLNAIADQYEENIQDSDVYSDKEKASMKSRIATLRP